MQHHPLSTNTNSHVATVPKTKLFTVLMGKGAGDPTGTWDL